MKLNRNWTSRNLRYVGKQILAPMVRAGTLPLRLLALDYGADLVYSDELYATSLLQAQRQVNDVLGTIDFVNKLDGFVVFRTCAREKDKVIVQLGTCDPDNALAAAEVVQADVSGIDVNMGCPKRPALLIGTGAALLHKPLKAAAIMQNLVDHLTVPVTCKVRVLNHLEDTIDLCKRLQDTGIAAIAVHGRTKKERPQFPNNNAVVREVALALDIPVIANGGSLEIEIHEDIEKFRDETGCASVMIARAAQDNCSIFRSEGLLPVDDVLNAYLRYCTDYDNDVENTKYNAQHMLQERQRKDSSKTWSRPDLEILLKNFEIQHSMQQVV